MMIRIAKPCDAHKIAMVHYECAPQDFICALGKRFLRSYYKILLSEPDSIIVCAVRPNSKIVGFLVGTIKAENHIIAMRKKSIKLLISALPTLINKPNLLIEVLKRRKVASSNTDNDYVVTEGPHLEFWGIIEAERKTGLGVKILKSLLLIMNILDVNSIRCEVDEDHEKVAQVHIRHGANIVRKFITPEGKKRMILEYSSLKDICKSFISNGNLND